MGHTLLKSIVSLGTVKWCICLDSIRSTASMWPVGSGRGAIEVLRIERSLRTFAGKVVPTSVAAIR